MRWLRGTCDLFTSVGVFNLATNSKDAALSVTLHPGSYTAQVSDGANTTGVALAETYELPLNPRPASSRTCLRRAAPAKALRP